MNSETRRPANAALRTRASQLHGGGVMLSLRGELDIATSAATGDTLSLSALPDQVLRLIRISDLVAG